MQNKIKAIMHATIAPEIIFQFIPETNNIAAAIEIKIYSEKYLDTYEGPGILKKLDASYNNHTFSSEELNEYVSSLSNEKLRKLLSSLSQKELEKFHYNLLIS